MKPPIVAIALEQGINLVTTVVNSDVTGWASVVVEEIPGRVTVVVTSGNPGRTVEDEARPVPKALVVG